MRLPISESAGNNGSQWDSTVISHTVSIYINIPNKQNSWKSDKFAKGSQLQNQVKGRFKSLRRKNLSFVTDISLDICCRSSLYPSCLREQLITPKYDMLLYFPLPQSRKLLSSVSFFFAAATKSIKQISTGFIFLSRRLLIRLPQATCYHFE